MMFTKSRWLKIEYLLAGLLMGAAGSNAAVTEEDFVNPRLKEIINFFDFEANEIKRFQLNIKKNCLNSSKEKMLCPPMIEIPDITGGERLQGGSHIFRRSVNGNDTDTDEGPPAATPTTVTEVTTSTTAAPRPEPTQEQLSYAGQHCQGGSYYTTVLVSPDEALWTTVREYIHRTRGSHFNPNHRVSFAEAGEPWEFDSTNRKGVLFLLPAGSSYTTTTALDYFDDRLGDERSSDNNFSAPRLGLCALSAEGQEKARLDLNGAGCGSLGLGDCSERRGFQTPPLRIQLAQVEMYGVHINGDQVDSSKWGIRVSWFGKADTG